MMPIRRVGNDTLANIPAKLAEQIKFNISGGPNIGPHMYTLLHFLAILIKQAGNALPQTIIKLLIAPNFGRQ
jgi:hypothetical protein